MTRKLLQVFPMAAQLLNNTAHDVSEPTMKSPHVSLSALFAPSPLLNLEFDL